MRPLPSVAQRPPRFDSSACARSPQAGSPSSQMVLPAGLACTRRGDVCGSSSGKARRLACSVRQVFMWRLLCAGPGATHSRLRESAPVRNAAHWPPRPLSSHPASLSTHSLACHPSFPLFRVPLLCSAAQSAHSSRQGVREPCSCPIDRALPPAGSPTPGASGSICLHACESLFCLSNPNILPES